MLEMLCGGVISQSEELVEGETILGVACRLGEVRQGRVCTGK